MPVKKKMPPGIKGRIYLAAKITIALAEGGMRFTFPPYGKKIEAVNLQNSYITKIPPVQGNCPLYVIKI